MSPLKTEAVWCDEDGCRPIRELSREELIKALEQTADTLQHERKLKRRHMGVLFARPVRRIP